MTNIQCFLLIYFAITMFYFVGKWFFKKKTNTEYTKPKPNNWPIPPPPPSRPGTRYWRFKDFELSVEKLSTKEDFEKRGETLKCLSQQDYQLFLDLLKLGYEIRPADYAVPIIKSLASKTNQTTGEVFYLIRAFSRLADLKNKK